MLAIVGLGVAGALAAIFTGGVAGPLAVWCLLPLAAAAVLNHGERLALGAAG
jgi:cell cycle sensor histidine kinase DivJ